LTIAFLACGGKKEGEWFFYATLQAVSGRHIVSDTFYHYIRT